jgi:hypothetical protein
MSSIPPPGKKAPKGTVVVEAFKGRLRLRFRVAGDRYCLAVGLPDLPENRKIAEAKAKQVALDIKAGKFDPSLAKYQTSKQTRVARNETMLDILWDKYTEYRRKQIEAPGALKSYSRFHKYVSSSCDLTSDNAADPAPDRIETVPANNSFINLNPGATRRVLSRIIESTSLINDYQKFRSYIENLPFKSLSNALEIQRYICVTQPPNSARYILANIDVCCEWATRVGLLSSNPFSQLTDCEELTHSTQMSD